MFHGQYHGHSNITRGSASRSLSLMGYFSHGDALRVSSSKYDGVRPGRVIGAAASETAEDLGDLGRGAVGLHVLHRRDGRRPLFPVIDAVDRVAARLTHVVEAVGFVERPNSRVAASAPARAWSAMEQALAGALEDEARASENCAENCAPRCAPNCAPNCARLEDEARLLEQVDVDLRRRTAASRARPVCRRRRCSPGSTGLMSIPGSRRATPCARWWAVARPP